MYLFVSFFLFLTDLTNLLQFELRVLTNFVSLLFTLKFKSNCFFVSVPAQSNEVPSGKH
jgi:hypothetical protein